MTRRRVVIITHPEDTSKMSELYVIRSKSVGSVINNWCVVPDKAKQICAEWNRKEYTKSCKTLRQISLVREVLDKEKEFNYISIEVKEYYRIGYETPIRVAVDTNGIPIYVTKTTRLDPNRTYLYHICLEGVERGRHGTTKK